MNWAGRGLTLPNIRVSKQSMQVCLNVYIYKGAWFTLHMTWICTYARLLDSQTRLNINRIRYCIRPLRIQDVGLYVCL